MQTEVVYIDHVDDALCMAPSTGVSDMCINYISININGVLSSFSCNSYSTISWVMVLWKITSFNGKGHYIHGHFQ